MTLLSTDTTEVLKRYNFSSMDGNTSFLDTFQSRYASTVKLLKSTVSGDQIVPAKVFPRTFKVDQKYANSLLEMINKKIREVAYSAGVKCANFCKKVSFFDLFDTSI